MQFDPHIWENIENENFRISNLVGWFVSPIPYREKSWIPSISISEEKVGQLVTSRSGRFYCCFTKENDLKIVAIFGTFDTRFRKLCKPDRDFYVAKGPASRAGSGDPHDISRTRILSKNACFCSQKL